MTKKQKAVADYLVGIFSKEYEKEKEWSYFYGFKSYKQKEMEKCEGLIEMIDGLGEHLYKAASKAGYSTAMLNSIDNAGYEGYRLLDNIEPYVIEKCKQIITI